MELVDTLLDRNFGDDLAASLIRLMYRGTGPEDVMLYLRLSNTTELRALILRAFSA